MMRNSEAFKYLKIWAKSYFKDSGSKMKLKFDEELPLGYGTINEEKGIITIGIEPYEKNFLSAHQRMKDKDFVKMGVTLFHEITHHEQKIQNDTSEEIQMSELSKYGNLDYYKYNHHKMPHEIDAEYTGVMTMWNRLEEIFPGKADKLILEHLTHRATDTVYMINVPEEGFVSKEQVETLFEQAYDNASRELPSGFLRSDDETARMLTTEDKVLRPEYAPIYNKLTAPLSGEVMDRMMASLVSYIHPELQADYPDIDFDRLKPPHVFKVPIPETTEEIRERLGLDDDFAKAVESLDPDDSRLML